MDWLRNLIGLEGVAGKGKTFLSQILPLGKRVTHLKTGFKGTLFPEFKTEGKKVWKEGIWFPNWGSLFNPIGFPFPGGKTLKGSPKRGDFWLFSPKGFWGWVKTFSPVKSFFWENPPQKGENLFHFPRDFFTQKGEVLNFQGGLGKTREKENNPNGKNPFFPKGKFPFILLTFWLKLFFFQNGFSKILSGKHPFLVGI